MSSELVIRVVFVLLQGCIVEGGVARPTDVQYLVQPIHVQGLTTVGRSSKGLDCSVLVVAGRRHFMVGSLQEIRDKLENAGR